MKEFEKIESLLKSKAYDELTSSERSLVDEELTEETYEEIRLSMNLLKGEQLKVGKDVKKELMKEFRQKEPGIIYSLTQFKLPAYTHVFSLALIIYLIFFIPKPTPVVQDRIVEVMVRDTVEITQVKVDTFLIEKVIKVPTPVYVTQELEANEPQKVNQVSNRTLSDQKEVMDLVVRGLK